MNRKIYRTIYLMLLTIVSLTGDAFAFTVVSDEETFPPQALRSPSLDPYNYQQETTIRLTFMNFEVGASTEIWRSTDSESGYQLIATVAPGIEEYSDQDLKPRTVFYYK